MMSSLRETISRGVDLDWSGDPALVTMAILAIAAAFYAYLGKRD